MIDPQRILRQLVQPAIGLALLFVWPGPQVARELRRTPEPVPEPRLHQVVVPTAEPDRPPAAGDWYSEIRASCTPMDVLLATDLHPAPTGGDGPAYEAACFAIAGDIPKARSLILAMQPERRAPAAGVLFSVAMETYDAGSDPAAGPAMDLVLEFWPNHHLALYYAGTARYLSGDLDAASPYFERFIRAYGQSDDWSRDARRMLQSLQER